MPVNYTIVYDNSERPVAAKTLVDSFGHDVINPATGMAYVVPADYDIQDSIDLGMRFRALLTGRVVDDYLALGQIAQALGRDGPEDLQRSYNGLVGQGGSGFVGAFTDIASFHFGLALRAAGLDIELAMWAGGRHNNLPQNNTSGLYGLNPDVDDDILVGFQFYNAGRWGGSPLPAAANPNLAFSPETRGIELTFFRDEEFFSSGITHRVIEWMDVNNRTPISLHVTYDPIATAVQSSVITEFDLVHVARIKNGKRRVHKRRSALGASCTNQGQRMLPFGA